jgi:hypothetical protein
MANQVITRGTTNLVASGRNPKGPGRKGERRNRCSHLDCSSLRGKERADTDSRMKFSNRTNINRKPGVASGNTRAVHSQQ